MKVFEKLEELMDLGGTKKDIAFLVISAIALALSLMDITLFGLDMAWVAIILCGAPIILGAIIGLITEFDIKADVLVSLALVASVAIGEDFAAGEIAFIMQLGALLEDLTVANARAGIEKLVHLTPQTARVLNEGGESIIPAEQVTVGDRIRVLPGEVIPVDGKIIQGSTSINQAVMTGESLPVDKTVGDEVSSGTVNQFGAFEMVAQKVGEDSSIQRMIKLVQSADAGKAKIVRLADQWATWIVVIALTAAVITWFVSGELNRSVTILVVFCPCALVLATPTAIMAAIGNATKHGFLVREGDALERLATVTKICFDKTGTLTYGTPQVCTVESTSVYTPEDIYALAAAAEVMSEHPLGKAIVRCYKDTHDTTPEQPEAFSMIPGRGVTAVIAGRSVKVGSISLFEQASLSEETATHILKHQNAGGTLIYVGSGEEVLGYLVLTDTLREESAAMVSQIADQSVTSVLLTGDNEYAAQTIGRKLGIQEIQANCLPEHKLEFINAAQTNGTQVCMIGDGINDAPALKKAHVGIAMGGIGSDIAVDAADIVLVDDDVKELPHLVALSKRMMTTITLNLTFSMSLNFIAIVLAITGLMGPVVGALVHNLGSVMVIVNSAFLLRWKRK